MRLVSSLFISTSLLFMACDSQPKSPAASDTEFSVLNQSTPAWGERIRIEPQMAYMRFDSRIIPLTGQLIDLPPPPPKQPNNSQSSILSIDEYNTTLSSQSYTNRGYISFLNQNRQNIKTIRPYGSLKPNLIEFLASVKPEYCKTLFNSTNLDMLKTNIGDFKLFNTAIFKESKTKHPKHPKHPHFCHGIINIGKQSTQEALDKLSQILGKKKTLPNLSNKQGFVVDKVSVMNLMNSEDGVYAYDPTCSEIKNSLDFIAQRDFHNLYMPTIRQELNKALPYLSGDNTKIIIIGGGSQDKFTCKPEYSFSGHDDHIESIIKQLAPDADIKRYKACDIDGSCLSSSVNRNLLYTLRRVFQSQTQGATLVNLSLGGPLPNKVMYEIIRFLGIKHVNVIVSSGNTPSAPAQFPASYAKGVAPTNNALDNIISVAALGKQGDNYYIAAFNTRKNANVFVPGVNLCPPSTLNNRCTGNTFPNNLGITGTSFAAPVATALAALMIEASGTVPNNLLECFKQNLHTDPKSQVKYPVLNKPICN